MVATTRIVFPASVVRLSAGRTSMNTEAQALCFLAGANSIFAGDKLLTTPNPEFNEDQKMFELLGLTPKEPFVDGDQPESHPDPIIAAKQEAAQKRAEELAQARQVHS